jgi:hypothetical protein
MKDGAFHHVIGCVRDRDDAGAGLRASALEKLIAQRARACLHRAARHRALPALDQHLDAEALAQVTDVVGDSARTRLQRMVVVSRDHVTAVFVKGQQQRGAVGPARNGDEYSIAGRDQAGLSKPKQQRV